MQSTLLRWVEALMAALRVASGAMLIASVCINFVNIIGRYVFSVSLSWAEETMLFLMIGSVFLAAGPVGYLGRHIRMDVVVLLLPPRARKTFEIFSDVVTAATCIMLAELDQRSDTANIPLALPQAALPIGLVLMAFLIIVRLLVHGVPHAQSDTREGSGHK